MALFTDFITHTENRCYMNWKISKESDHDLF